ncbi:hypothetical protein HYQ44_015454 [Verticillium longisporum]|nr:hypothetical protein HYQ44_015454 [Verticillium longisporum]
MYRRAHVMVAYQFAITTPQMISQPLKAATLSLSSWPEITEAQVGMAANRNLNALNFDLQTQELEEISGLDLGLHFNDPGLYLPGRPLCLLS